jgi:hypothetical protein
MRDVAPEDCACWLASSSGTAGSVSVAGVVDWGMADAVPVAVSSMGTVVVMVGVGSWASPAINGGKRRVLRKASAKIYVPTRLFIFFAGLEIHLIGLTF